MRDLRGSMIKGVIDRSSRLPWVVIALGVLLSLFGWQFTLRTEGLAAQAIFDAHAKEHLVVIRDQFEQSTAALEDLAAVYAASDEVSPEAFGRIAKSILARRPVLAALSWNPVVSLAERPVHEAAVRRAGLAGYQIQERAPSGKFISASDRDQYVVVVAIEPREGNEAAIGFDVASERTRRLALERARDTGEIAVADPVTLVQAPEHRQSALVFLPRYRSVARVASVEERREHLKGFFVAVVDVAQTVDSALAKLGPHDVGLSLYCFSDASAEGHRLYGPESSVDSVEADDADSIRTSALRGRSRSTLSFEWGGQEMRALFTETEALPSGLVAWIPSGVLFGGLLLTGLVGAYVNSLRGRTARIEREVADRTRELRDANRGLEAEVARRETVEKKLTAYRDDLERAVNERTAELRSTSSRLRTIVDSEPECVKVVTATGELEAMNAAGLKMIEAESFEEVKGKNIYPLIAEPFRKEFEDLNRRVIAGESATLEFQLNGLQGGTRWVETHAVPLVESEGGPVLHLAITRDITKRKQAEEGRRELEAQLRHAQKLESIGVLAGGIAHDFNNLLQVIVGNTERALEQMPPADSAREALESSQLAASEAAKLCDQMLTYAGQSRPSIQKVSLANLVRSIAGLLKVSFSKKAEVEFDLGDGLPMVEGDDVQLSQVIMNLLTNASESIGTERGQIGVRIREVESRTEAPMGTWVGGTPPEARFLSLEVSDTGCGIPAASLERIFDPFFTTKFAGRGLGLASTLGIIRSHDGFLNVWSHVGQGTTFTIWLPIADSVVLEAPREELSLESARFEWTVLVVDDEEQIRKLARSMLESCGCRVVEAADGEEAIRVFGEQSDDVGFVLLDETMPKLSGTETYARLREIRPAVPVIFCSGYVNVVASLPPNHGSFTAFLHKPYRRAELIAVLRDVMGWLAARDLRESSPSAQAGAQDSEQPFPT